MYSANAETMFAFEWNKDEIATVGNNDICKSQNVFREVGQQLVR